MATPAIEITDLRKRYAPGKGQSEGHEALKGISISVQQGEFFGLLGPNGAGKSTIINILSGVTNKTSGTVRVHGHEVDEEPMVTKRLLGVVPQEITADHFFNVDETLQHQSGFYGRRHNDKHINELLRALSLEDKRKVNSRMLSGGMKRRLLVAKAMVHEPPVLILDEPTAGVDVELRQNLYAYVNKINQAGVTVLLTTHYLEEAEALCDRIAIINKGEVVALDTTQNLLMKLGKERQLVIALKEAITVPDAFNQFRPVYDQKQNKLSLHFSSDQYEAVLAAMSNAHLPITSFRVEEENLEDIFLKLTSH